LIQPGIFAKTFDRPSLTGVLDAVVENGFNRLQFNMACAGLSSMPENISFELVNQIANEVSVRNLRMDALSGTFNMIHPDKQILERGLKSLKALIYNAKQMGTSIITLCTGSCDAEDMWRFHPGNNSREAWSALCSTLERALVIAESKGVILGVEPELANVINSADKARRILDEMQSRHLKIIFDPANLFEKAAPTEIEKIITYGLELLGKDIVIAHAKDRKADGSFTAAGLGVLPYSFFIHQLRETGFEGTLITHGLKETEAKQCAIFLTKQLTYVNQ
jgi:sugar phosphate isomerase/epimerase